MKSAERRPICSDLRQPYSSILMLHLLVTNPLEVAIIQYRVDVTVTVSLQRLCIFTTSWRYMIILLLLLLYYYYPRRRRYMQSSVE